jgi:hypothetical protein
LANVTGSGDAKILAFLASIARRRRIVAELREASAWLAAAERGVADLDEAAFAAHQTLGRVVGDLCQHGGLG